MIVASMFEGDADMAVAGKQHDVYRDALGLMIDTANRITRCAKYLLSDTQHETWGEITAVDHRALQEAHDLLAAAWRFRHHTKQLEMPLDLDSQWRATTPLEHQWLSWLRRELETWVWSPDLVRHVQIILAHTNQAIGYVSESELCLALMDRFGDVPWQRSLRAAYEADLARDVPRSAARMTSSIET